MTNATIESSHSQEQLQVRPAILTLRGDGTVAQWVAFDADKQPYDAVLENEKGEPISVFGALVAGNPHWHTYHEAVACFCKHQASGFIKGIGREFIKEQGITGVDLDHCIDEHGNLTAWGRFVVNLLNSYTELSPSGHGLHIWVYGTLKSNIVQSAKGYDGDEKTEAYDHARFFTITEQHYAETPVTIEHRQEQLDTLVHLVQERRDQAKAAAKKTTKEAPAYHPPTGLDTPYGLAALVAEQRELATAFEGGRNEQLNLSAFRLGQLVGGGELSRLTVEQALEQAAQTCGLNEREIEKTLASGLDAGINHPRSAPVVEADPVSAPDESDDTEADEDEDGQPKKAKISQEMKLRSIIATEADLFTTPAGGEYFATITENGRTRTLELGDRDGPFKHWLIRRYILTHGGPAVCASPNPTALSQAICAARALADGGPQRDVFTRIAHAGECIYLDLANEQGQKVEISASGWRVVTDVPVLFKTPNGLEPLPVPIKGGTLSVIGRFINTKDTGDLLLITAWLAMCFHPTGPFPLLSITGERGAAKSTATKFLKFLIDPSKAMARKEPEDDRTLAILAQNSAVLAFDNLSRITPTFSDALCRIATGAGDAYRALYSNDTEIIFSAKRPVVLNGIEELVTRGDLLDRTMIVSLPEIEEDRRMMESDYWQAATDARPRILGALCDALVTYLREGSRIRLKGLDRMADFEHFAIVIEKHLTSERGAFKRVYRENRAAGVSVELDASPLATILQRFIRDRWEGGIQELYDALVTLGGDELTKQRGWPGSAHILSGKLTRLAPSLRASGLNVQKLARSSKGNRIVIERTPTAPNPDENSDNLSSASVASHTKNVASESKNVASKNDATLLSDHLVSRESENSVACVASGGVIFNLGIMENEENAKNWHDLTLGSDTYKKFTVDATHATHATLNGSHSRDEMARNGANGVPIDSTGVKQIRAEIAARLRAFEAMEPPDEKARRDALWPPAEQPTKPPTNGKG